MDEDIGLISSIAKLASDDPSVSRVTIHQAFQDELQDVRDAVHHCKMTYLPSIATIWKRKGDVTDQTVGKKPDDGRCGLRESKESGSISEQPRDAVVLIPKMTLRWSVQPESCRGKWKHL
jgi:hypothetical protein